MEPTQRSCMMMCKKVYTVMHHDPTEPIELRVLTKWVLFGQRNECCYLFIEKYVLKITHNPACHRLVRTSPYAPPSPPPYAPPSPPPYAPPSPPPDLAGFGPLKPLTDDGIFRPEEENMFAERVQHIYKQFPYEAARSRSMIMRDIVRDDTFFFGLNFRVSKSGNPNFYCCIM
ncbi:hypothetical protein L1987_36996 [Smallanthus sonchifolius]|uniref:Uncharacterized protein n=1 Tax=Smallanthus sonchifolius TaxID=185202 RepID=A0ACB9HGG7_9ASTR|nr:hypothetical protein L1987_36996 [Smallanthus sonchifolius]